MLHGRFAAALAGGLLLLSLASMWSVHNYKAALIAKFNGYNYRSGQSQSPTIANNASYTGHLLDIDAARDFWGQFNEMKENLRPSFDQVDLDDSFMPWIRYNPERVGADRPDRVVYDQAKLEELKRLRKEAIDRSQKIGKHLQFVPGTRGIAVASDFHLHGIQTTSLYMLRAAGSRLPVEVWLRDQDSYEEKLCEEIWPSLGARCMLMSDYLPEGIDPAAPDNRYMSKILALVFSTFQQVLTLDCDVFPVTNPDSLFDTEPFISKKFILWPDLWANTVSHHWFDMADMPVPNMKERASTESGEIIVDKAVHAETFVMALYYNYYGTRYWFPLLSQGATGMGDKESYLAAVKDMGNPWYQVYEQPRYFGYHCGQRERALGLLQYHPHDDFIISSNNIVRHGSGMDLHEAPEPRILFMHDGVAKPDPHTLLDFSDPGQVLEDLMRCEVDGPVHRMMGPKELAFIKYGWDVELALWSALRWLACTHEGALRFWTEPTFARPAEKLRTDACWRISQHWDALFPEYDYSDQVPTTGARPERVWW